MDRKQVKKMKRLIIGIALSMALLTGCVGGNQEPIIQEALYDVEQDDMLKFSDLTKEIEQSGINFERVSGEDDPTMQYSYSDDNGHIIVFVDGLASPDHQIIRQIIIRSELDLSQHPMVKILAPIVGEEKLLAWVAKQENQVAETAKQKDEEQIIQDVLALNRSYMFFEYWPGSKYKVLEFTWAPKPHIPVDFEEIAQQLEEHDIQTTSYIEGVGGQTLTATNSDYYSLTKTRHNRTDGIEPKGDIGQAAAYKVMGNKDKPNNYSVQLYGYMEENLSYKTRVEEMPGLDEITKLMNMDEEDFSRITEKVNEELTKARELLNYNLQQEYYLEGDVGDYHYIIMVPEGIKVYRFTVLIE